METNQISLREEETVLYTVEVFPEFKGSCVRRKQE